MDSPLRILYLEDNAADAELTQETLAIDGIACDVVRVETEPEFRRALEQAAFDLILADYSLPSFDGISALTITRRQSTEVPFIFVSGAMGEEVAIEALKVGATDYVLKTRLSRLAPAVRRALREAKEHAELQRAERELQERDAKIRRLVEANIVGIFSWDLDGQIIDANDAFLRIVGYDREDLLAGRLRWTDLTPPEWLDRDQRLLVPELKVTGSLQPFEKEYFRKDGSRVPVLIAIASFEGSRNQGVAFVLDLTERKRAEEAARAARARFEGIVQIAGDAIISIDYRQRILLFNQGAEKIFGYAQDEVIGCSLDILLPGRLTEVHRKHVEEFFQSAETARRMGQRSEVSGRRKDGSEFPAEASISKLDLGGEVVFTVILRDITERKLAEEALLRSEAYLAEAQKLTHTGSWAFRRNAKAAYYWSEENFRIWDFDPQQGFPDREMIRQRIHPDDRERAHEIGVQAVKAKTDWQDEFRIVLPDGTARHIRVLGHPVVGTTGEVIETVGTHVDVTERKRAEAEREKLRQLEADLAHLNRITTMGELAVSLAHELKQPIAAAITSSDSCLQWLMHNPPNLDRARMSASRIKADATRAADIIDRLRSLYKKAPPERDLVAVKDVIGEMVLLLRPEANRHAVSIRTDFAANLPMVMADRVQLQQVLLNLMLNAIDAMKDTGGILTLRSQLENNCLLVSLSDTGVGLPAGKADQIFDAFFTTKVQGSGMGLAISRSIVESHGGRLWATANDGRGATFHFTLPVATEECP